MDGFEACRRVVAMCSALEVAPAVILLTGSESMADMSRGFTAGADDIVTKSSNPSILRVRMQALLRRRTLQKQELQTERDTPGSEARFTEIAENVREVFWMISAATDEMLYVNLAYERIWGRSRESLYKDPMSWVDSILPADRERALATFQQQMRGELVESAYRIERPDGGVRWLSVRAFPVHDSDGKIIRVGGIAEDVTERKVAEEAMEQALDDAEAGNRAKSQFLNNISHEFRTPMNAILGMTELALDTELSSQQHEYLSVVKTSADSLLEIINDVLDFSGLETDKLQLEHAEFDLRGCIALSENAFKTAAALKDLTLTYEIAPGIPATVVGDHGRVSQVLTKLLSNGIKFTESGGVSLSVKAISTKRSGAILHFIVTDTGIGIPAEKQRSIFESFTQGDGATTRKFGGTGLGLTIASKLVRMMGGMMWLNSEVGKGSAFHVAIHFAENVAIEEVDRPLETGRFSHV
jgi:PAS domain S-box-containing protein